MMPQALIFIGRSGCGKGTQVKMLTEALDRIDPSVPSLCIQTGQFFREFIQGESITQKESRAIYDAGGLQPEFLTVHMWVKPLVENYRGNQHVIFDGTPRKYHEAGVLHSAFQFYGFKMPWLINIEISPEEALKRLLSRQRMDDNEFEIKKRLSWYETDVAPTIKYYENNPDYHFLKIDGERSVDEIHAEIVKKVGLS